ncbi:hypothetical protein HWV62_21892 [Athelia sp. TMB]|nr:hypothetical protein HWV62_21892 [Athelia sp. TMB]
MATFEGTDIVDLPRLIRHFLVPVFPTVSPDTKKHIHTSPQWRGQMKPQWILALPMKPGRLWLKTRWRDDRGRGPTHYQVDPDPLVEFEHACLEREVSWRHLPELEKKSQMQEYMTWVKIPSAIAKADSTAPTITLPVNQANTKTPTTNKSTSRKKKETSVRMKDFTDEPGLPAQKPEKKSWSSRLGSLLGGRNSKKSENNATRKQTVLTPPKPVKSVIASNTRWDAFKSEEPPSPTHSSDSPVTEETVIQALSDSYAETLTFEPQELDAIAEDDDTGNNLLAPDPLPAKFPIASAASTSSANTFVPRTNSTVEPSTSNSLLPSASIPILRENTPTLSFSSSSPASQTSALSTPAFTPSSSPSWESALPPGSSVAPKARHVSFQRPWQLHEREETPAESVPESWDQSDDESHS